jgi:uncharacterized membrane protein YkvA (DUF1232 family)
VPWLAKLVPPAALGYVIFPVDILPDMILGLGQVDDLAILLLGVKLFIELCPTELVTEHLRALGAQLQEQQAEQVVEGEYEVIDPGGQ